MKHLFQASSKSEFTRCARALSHSVGHAFCDTAIFSSTREPKKASAISCLILPHSEKQAGLAKNATGGNKKCELKSQPADSLASCSMAGSLLLMREGARLHVVCLVLSPLPCPSWSNCPSSFVVWWGHYKKEGWKPFPLPFRRHIRIAPFLLGP